MMVTQCTLGNQADLLIDLCSTASRSRTVDGQTDICFSRAPFKGVIVISVEACIARNTIVFLENSQQCQPEFPQCSDWGPHGLLIL